MSDYYKFGKVQVLDISRHLTSNAGQAVQYIARSCRLDGNNKGEVEADLRKAIDFLTDELDRIGCPLPLSTCEQLKRLKAANGGTVIREHGGTKMVKVANRWQDYKGGMWSSEQISDMGPVTFD